MSFSRIGLTECQDVGEWSDFSDHWRSVQNFYQENWIIHAVVCDTPFANQAWYLFAYFREWSEGSVKFNENFWQNIPNIAYYNFNVITTVHGNYSGNKLQVFVCYLRDAMYHQVTSWVFISFTSLEPPTVQPEWMLSPVTLLLPSVSFIFKARCLLLHSLSWFCPTGNNNFCLWNFVGFCVYLRFVRLCKLSEQVNNLKYQCDQSVSFLFLLL